MTGPNYRFYPSSTERRERPASFIPVYDTWYTRVLSFFISYIYILTKMKRRARPTGVGKKNKREEADHTHTRENCIAGKHTESLTTGQVNSVFRQNLTTNPSKSHATIPSRIRRPSRCCERTSESQVKILVACADYVLPIPGTRDHVTR